MAPHVLITGANRGIGLEFARQYKQAGWRVSATVRRLETAEGLRDIGVDVLQLNVREVESFAAFAAGFKAAPVDLFINNAGVYGNRGSAQALGSVDVGSFQDTLLVNAIAPLKLMEALLPLLEAAVQPKAVFVSSSMGSVAENESGGEYIYRTSKAALNMIVSTLAVDLRGRVCVAALHPGWVRTDMGGPEALIDADVSVAGLRTVIEALAPSETGAFRAFDGRAIPW